jgi:ubiquinone/menaquinone biosynthesis C-methylase UbiE
MAHTGRPWTDHKPPSAAPVWAAIEGLARYNSLVAALELDVFDVLADVGPAEVAPLAASLDVDEANLGALLDALVVQGFLEQIRDVYDLNDTARRYLCSEGTATMVDLVPVAPGPAENWTRLADTVRDGRPATPVDGDGVDPAEFYVPLVEGTFTTIHRAATRADLRIGYSRLRAPKVLDLGAGGAPWSIAILEACLDATAVVNDWPGVLTVAENTTATHGVRERVRFRPGDFHEIEIEPAAYDVVVLGHVCRTEGPQRAPALIARAFEALKPGGRLILADYFADNERKMNSHAVIMGLTMAASTANGGPLTARSVHSWLDDAGFEAIRMIEPIGFQFAYVATRPGERAP